MRARSLLPAAALALAACGDDASAPRGALGRYVAIGASLTAGFMSDGLVYEGQSSAYPARLARAAGSDFAEARVQSPGCVPPLVAPLLIDRTLSGRRAFEAPRDSSCLGRFADSVFATNVAVPEMTAYQALRFTPDSAARLRDVRARRAAPEILLDGFSQVTQARLARATFVSVELGFSEIVRAVRTGRMVAATAESYRADTAFTFVPFDEWRPVYDSVLAVLVDSAGVRRGVLVQPPLPSRLAGLVPGAVLHAQRDSLRRFGVALAADCEGSANRVYVAKVAAAAAAAARAGAARALGCADVAGATDSVLAAGEFDALEALAARMRAHVAAAADARGWALADANPSGAPSAEAFRVTAYLASSTPFAAPVSLDGLHPNAEGHLGLLIGIGRAIEERYGVSLALPSFAGARASP